MSEDIEQSEAVDTSESHESVSNDEPSSHQESNQSHENVSHENVSHETNEPAEDKSTQETPEWFMKDKYKSVEAQAKAAFELQKKMGKYWGSPDEKYSVEGLEGLKENDPLVANLMPALKDMGISQEGFKHLVGEYMKANVATMKALEDELKQTLTKEDAFIYKDIDSWMNKNLTKQEQELVKNNWLMSADDFKLFNSLRLMAGTSTSVPSSTTSPVNSESSKQITNEKTKYLTEVKQGLRVEDKNHWEDLNRRFRDAVARESRQASR